MNKARTLTVLLWISAIVLLAWVLKDMPIGTMLNAVSALSIGQWGLWLGVNLLVLALSTQRWLALIRSLSGSVPALSLLLIRLGGQFVSFVTPGPQFGGEPLQVYWLYKRQGLPLHKAILSLGVDRFLELWVNFAVLLLGAILLLLSPGMAFADWGQIALVLTLLLLAIPFLIFLVLKRPQWISLRLQTLFARWLSHPRLAALNAHQESLKRELDILVNLRRAVLLRGLLTSLLTWVFILAELWLLLSFIGVAVEPQGFALIAVAIRLAMLLPLPGGIGTIEAALLWSMQQLGFTVADAFALIVLMRLRDTLILFAGAASLALLR